MTTSFAERPSSHSPSRGMSLFSAIGAKLSRTRSASDNTAYDDEDRDSVCSDLSILKTKAQDRSQSRGREVYSSGRGGFGNLRQASVSKDRPDGPDDFSSSRGREPVIDSAKIYSTGRGGAGNIRSPSRDAPRLANDPVEEDVIQSYIAAKQDAPQSTGRGGIGNITSRSRSRDPSAPVFHSTGRGGAGNIVVGDPAEAEFRDEEERRRVVGSGDGYHSTGRGGVANLTTKTGPGVERTHRGVGEFESTGRGGVGNIIQDRSRSRPRN